MIERYFDGLGSPEELERRLAEDPAFADAFVKAARRDQALAELFQEERAVSRFRAFAPKRCSGCSKWIPLAFGSRTTSSASWGLLGSSPPPHRRLRSAPSSSVGAPRSWRRVAPGSCSACKLGSRGATCRGPPGSADNRSRWH